MSPKWREATLGSVRDLIARAALGDDPVEPALGDVTLMPHQCAAVRTVRASLSRFGGALLADEVGLGKTFTALGVARHYTRRLVVAPASLRSMWQGAMARSRCEASFASYEQLSGGRAPGPGSFDLVVLDEAHHARNPAARRYHAVARLTWGARVLLVSATPLHNHRRDLIALLALFLGSGARDVSDELLAAIVCRRRAQAEDGLQVIPTLRPVEWHTLAESPAVMRDILSLPPPLPPAEGGKAAALSALTLLRAWCSSDAALLGAIRRRLEVALALEHALSHGRYPTRDELRRWTADDGAVQLAFPELVTGGEALRLTSVLLECVRGHAVALRRLRESLENGRARDDERFAMLRRIVTRHEGARVLVFTHSADTARAAYRALLPCARVACLTGSGGIIASGVIARQEVLDAFAPGMKREEGRGNREASVAAGGTAWVAASFFEPDGQGLPPADTLETLGKRARASTVCDLNVLVTTDVLSEGVDLHSASVVVHLDLPWTMARLEQRVGRARRIGARHAEVVQHAIAPPVDARELALVVGHLAAKARLSRALVGTTQEVLDEAAGARAPPTGSEAALSPADAATALRQVLTPWTIGAPSGAGEGGAPSAPGECIVATVVSAGVEGVIAVLRESGCLTLVSGDPGAPSTDPRAVLQLAVSPVAVTVRADPCRVGTALSALDAWCASQDAARDTLSGLASGTVVHRMFARRLAQSLAAAPRHLRQRRAAEVDAARDIVLRSTGIGAEHVLSTLLATAPNTKGPGGLGEAAWLVDVAMTLTPNATGPTPALTRTTIVALLLIVSEARTAVVGGQRLEP